MQYLDLHPALPAWMKALDNRLSSFFADEYALIHDAGMAVLTTRGKRLRPVFLLLSCACFRELPERAMTFAAVLELIHTASLIHDDVVDEAETRRGLPSAPARWGSKFSVLLGDFFFTRVFDLAISDGDSRVLRLLASTASDMSRAAMLEYANLLAEVNEERYWQIVRGKTAMLFAAATAIGSIIGDASPEQQQAAFAFGEYFGSAFQLADDLLDLQGSEHDSGKPLGMDWRQRRPTLPLIIALRQASQQVRKKSASSGSAIRSPRSILAHLDTLLTPLEGLNTAGRR